MAAATVLPVMNGYNGKDIHPFFRPPTIPDVHERNEAVTGQETVEAVEEEAEEHEILHDQPLKAKKKRKSNGPVNDDGKGKRQKTLQDIVKPKASSSALPIDETKPEVISLCSSDPVVAPARRRRRTGEDLAPKSETQNCEPTQLQDHTVSPMSPRVVILASPLPDGLPVANSQAPRTPPKKVLKLNASGKFSSPITRKDHVNDEPAIPKRRGRSRKAKDVKSPKQLLVKIAYGADEATRATVGQRIDKVLAGEDSVPTVSLRKRTTPKKPHTPKKPAKSTHPFFLGKPDEPPPVQKHESPQKSTATTPGKLRSQVYANRQPEVAEAPYLAGSALLKDRLMVKHPGAKEPPWPNREQTHVRSLDGIATTSRLLGGRQSGQRPLKRKTAQLPFPPAQSVLQCFASSLVPEEDMPERADGFRDPLPSLRVPDRLLISGHEIRQRIAPELLATLLERGQNGSLQNSVQPSTHPALQKLWDRLPSISTAFDNGCGENSSWTQKYAPAAATEVLQPARNMTALRDWLTSLTVTSVESTSAPQSKHAMKPQPKPRKKRRRKPDDLDDFLVDSDEDLRDMDKLDDTEDVLTAPGTTMMQTSVIQVAAEGTKLSNAVLLSGRHGCGKTAAAYAVAKELGFKVFEISPHERRSGKDVLDKVGDMAENHLVKHHGVETGDLSSTEELNKARLEEAFQHDLASGRQGKMDAFFSTKAQAKKAAPKHTASVKAKSLEALQTAIKKPPKDQQQSLILLEEVDILFKDDKDFWITVLKLIATSKRPFIMTCNDEDLVPLQAMSLHAILRFTPPPADLATDYMLLVAAAEGHILKRDAVASLYQSKHHDLRAALTELHMWCQMGIGDPRGGLSWIYQRWPPGSDVDTDGRKLRVVSRGTYQQGMGFSPDQCLNMEEQTLWMWNHFGFEPTSRLTKAKTTSGAELAGGSGTSHERLVSLRKHAACAETLSALDAYTAIGLLDTAPLDATQPTLSEKARRHYVEGLPLLQADLRIDHPSMSMQLVVATTCGLTRLAFPTSGVMGEREHPPYRRERSPACTPLQTISSDAPGLTRHNFACFDAISVPSDNALVTNIGMVQSAFDGPLGPIATDIAPYVRSIVQYDLALEEQRERLNTILADSDGRKAKRARTTRAARSALEGSQRASTRRERWFAKGLDLQAVLGTGGSEWPKITLSGPEAMSVDSFEAPISSGETT